MAFANFSITTVYTAIITALNTQLTAVASLFTDQTTGDFVGQKRISSSGKRIESWSGSAWVAVDLSLMTTNYSALTGTVPTWNQNTTGSAAQLGGVAAASYAKLASPPLTGTPTAPTAAVGTNTTQIATMAAIQAANVASLQPNGYVKLAGGLILQWGSFQSTLDIPEVFTFPTPFPTFCASVVTNYTVANSTVQLPIIEVTPTYFTINRYDGVDGSPYFFFFAIGY